MTIAYFLPINLNTVNKANIYSPVLLQLKYYQTHNGKYIFSEKKSLSKKYGPENPKNIYSTMIQKK
ncbi:hypothetical protein D3C86_1722750 [compost metagenome]